MPSPDFPKDIFPKDKSISAIHASAQLFSTDLFHLTFFVTFAIVRIKSIQK